MNIEAVRGFVNQSKTILDSSPQMDEANTKAAILRDFLELLDWEIPTNTQLEYSVDAFRQTYKVDYALVLEGTPVAFLEAKGADTTLTEDHEDQIDSYLTNANVNYGILTNGKQFRFFQRRKEPDVSVDRVGKVQLEELPSKFPVLKAFSKEAIESGESKTFLEKIHKLREARHTLESEKDDIATAVTELIAERVSDAISSMAESQSKEMIDRLIEDIENEIDLDRGEQRRKPGGNGKSDIKPRENKVAGTIIRSEIEGKDDAKVAVFPTKKSGLTFLKENNAWGFVRVGSQFDYVAMYVSQDERQVKYFAKVEDIVDPDEADLQRGPLEYVDHSNIPDDKMVVTFEAGSLYELEDPVPYESKYPQSLRYTTLGKLKKAETTDDLFGDSTDEGSSINEKAVLTAVRENPGSSLRTIHRTVAQSDDSEIEWVDGWSDERTSVQSALQSLRDQDSVRLEDRSWYPSDESESYD
jgi:hypothetical protein